MRRMRFAGPELGTFAARFTGGSDLACLAHPPRKLTSEQTFALIRQSILTLNPANVESAQLGFLGAARGISGTFFSIGLHRQEDGFLLDGMKPYLLRAMAGEEISVLEIGCGKSWAFESYWSLDRISFGFQSNKNHGQPWLSRLVASHMGGVSDTIDFTVSGDHNFGEGRAKDRIFLRDENGRLHSVYRKPTHDRWIPANDSQLWKTLAPYEADGTPNWRPWSEIEAQLAAVPDQQIVFTRGVTRLDFDPKRSHAIAFPDVDNTLEGLYNLQTADINYHAATLWAVPSFDNHRGRYDYIFGRHLPSHDNDWMENGFGFMRDTSVVQTVREMLKPGGEGRLGFDMRFAPGKSLKVVTKDRTSEGYALFPDGWGSR